MAIRQVKSKYATKDGRTWVVDITYRDYLSRPRKYHSKKFATRREAKDHEAEYKVNIKNMTEFTDLTFKQFNKVYPAIGSNYAYLSKVIYNLRVGTFDEIMSKFCENSKNITVRIRKDKTLIINDNLTGLKANDAYELLLSIQSKGNRKLFSQIRQAYKGFKHLNIDEFLFYSLCINYNNSRILNVLKPEEKETPVVNSPSKRKSLGMM